MCDWLSKDTRGGCGWVLRFGFSARDFWNSKSCPSQKKRDTGSFMTPHSSLMSDKQFNKCMNISSHVLIFGVVLPASKTQAMLIWGISRLSRLVLQHSSHISACSHALICTCSFCPLLPFFQTFLLSKRDTVIAWYQGVAHHCQESVPCCVPRGHIGFKWKLWEWKEMHWREVLQ